MRLAEAKATYDKLTGASPLVYHDDPFYLACDLAGSGLVLDDTNAKAYGQLLSEIPGWPAP